MTADTLIEAAMGVWLWLPFLYAATQDVSTPRFYPRKSVPYRTLRLFYTAHKASRQ